MGYGRGSALERALALPRAPIDHLDPTACRVPRVLHGRGVEVRGRGRG